MSGKTRPFAYALGDIFVSDKSLTNIVVLDNASILLFRQPETQFNEHSEVKNKKRLVLKPFFY